MLKYQITTREDQPEVLVADDAMEAACFVLSLMEDDDIRRDCSDYLLAFHDIAEDETYKPLPSRQTIAADFAAELECMKIGDVFIESFCTVEAVSAAF